MNKIIIQIIGTRKCRDTQKAERFFRERGIDYHFKDLNVKSLSEGELKNISASVDIEELIDREGKQFQKRGMKYKVFNTFQELLEDPLLLKTPVVRFGRKAAAGFKPEIWKDWLEKF